MKHSVFAYELNHYIYDRDLRQLAVDLLEGLPDYFYKIPASSTGTHHPAYALGEGGLVRHTKAAVKLAHTMIELEQYKELRNDFIITALLIHDGFKCGLPKEDGSFENLTAKDHPYLAANYVRNANFERKQDLSEIASLIETHMGQWYFGILPKPVSLGQRFVHLCDFLASRKFIDIEIVEK